MFEGVVIGWDGRPAAEEAVRWALRRPIGLRYRLLRVVDDRRAGPGDASPVALEAEAERAVRAEVDALGESHPAVRIVGEVAVGDAMTELERRTGPGALLVLGSDREPAVAARWRWTAPARVAAAAHGPVVLIPPGTAGRTGPVVVGVDGTAASLAAARRGAEVAAATWSTLLLLHAWQDAGEADDPGFLAHDPDGIGLDVETAEGVSAARSAPAAHAALLQDVLRTVRAPRPDLRVEGRLVHGSAPMALQREAADASLVVLGRHSRWSSDALLLGSVTHAMLLASPAPVLVVGRKDAPEPEEPVARTGSVATLGAGRQVIG